MKKIIFILSGVINAMVLGAILATVLNGYGPELDAKEVECMAKNIYYESRSEPIEGQIAVAQVTLNRVAHSNWPNDICSVVYEPKQFSWTWLEKDQTPNDPIAYKRAAVVARDVMIGNVVDPTHGAVFYHATYVNPDWNQYMEVSKVIGAHIFYVWDGQWVKKQKQEK